MIYRRRFDPNGHDSLAKLARWIRPGMTVLELGAAAGYFTEHLRAIGCTVDVVEVDRAAAGEAAVHARRVVVADLDQDSWVAELGDARYEVVLCADVLEHLRDGARLLRRLHAFLADGGALLLSVPNVAHSAIIARLIDERFDYGAEGLLDPTHLRLYTWRSLDATLQAAGYRVEAWEATTLAPWETEFRVRTEAFARPLREVLERRPHAFVYQWLARAVAGAAAEPLAPPPAATEATVPVRLLHARAPDELSLERAATMALPVGGTPADLAWPIPRGTHALRLLLADRRGVIEVRALALCEGESTLWSLDGDPARVAAGSGALPVSGRQYVLTEPDGWIAPLAPDDVVARADRLVATLCWPAGIAADADHALIEALASGMFAEREAARRSRELAEDIDRRTASERAQLAQVLAQLDEARSACSLARAALAARDSDVEDLERAVATYRGEIERLERALAAQERIIGYRQSLRWWLQLPFVRARLAWRRMSGA